MKVAIDLKKYRQRLGISQNKLAKRLNLSQGFISCIENDKKIPTIQILYKIASELNVCPRMLLRCTIECNKCTCSIRCREEMTYDRCNL
jgi:Predicted transcriptional regulator with C-terminal CBS domains